MLENKKICRQIIKCRCFFYNHTAIAETSSLLCLDHRNTLDVAKLLF